MSGDVALGLATVGALLIAVECNRPGRILPGAGGLLLLLLGLNRLRLFTDWRETSLWLAVGGLALIALVRWLPLSGLLGILGTGLLSAALVQLARHSGGELGGVPAACSGVLLGGLCTWLMLLAGRAWRAKRGHRGASAESFRNGVAERWGVD